MILKIIISCAVVGCVVATMPLNKEPPLSKKGPMHSLVESIIAKKLQQSEYRLPCTTVPLVYCIQLDPDFFGEKFTFIGNCTITMKVLQPTTTITLHRSDKIDVEKQATELIDENGKVLKPISQKWNPKNNFLSMKFSTRLKIGNYTLKMSWTGRDGSDDWYNSYSGFYRAINEDDSNESKYLVTTHFEPSSAREAFPCWDEPGKKAQFEFSIKHWPNYTALSNMPVKSRVELPDDRVITKFERSPLMSPYLPCLVVANYKHIENIHGNITFYTLESDLDSVKYALEISEKVIPAMEFYTGVPYALPKLDQVAIPQYSATAMEHWGLVSYVTHSVLTHNTSLLPDIAEKDSIEILIAHELAHQWFGNLISPIWWDDAWLNEAFADYFQYKVLEMIFPERPVMDIFVVEHVNEQSMRSESRSKSSNPIKWNPKTLREVERMFSQVTYAKGGAVLHMLDHILGEDVFRDGIRRYMKAHQFTAVNTDDLWDDLQIAYDEKYQDKPLNIKETMDPWIKQTGYPLVKVDRNYETGEVMLTQTNVMMEQNNKWKIPLNYATKSNPDFSSTLPTMWFEKNQDNVTIPNIDKDDWIIINIEQRGFYLVDYDEENWSRIADYLDSEDYNKISPVNRAQLIKDSFRMITMTESHWKKRVELFVNVTSYLHRETDYVPWLAATRVISEFDQIMEKTPEGEGFKQYMVYLMKKMLDDHMGDDYADCKTKILMAPFACKYGHPGCHNFSEEVISRYLQNPTEAGFNRYDNIWVICAGLKDVNETVWDNFMESSNNTKNQISPYEFLKCSNSEKIRDKYMNQLFTTNVPNDLSDILDVFRTFNNERYNVDYMLKYFIDNFEMIEKFFNEKEYPEYVIVMIATLKDAVISEDQFDKFKAFLEPHIEAFKVKYNEPDLDKLLENFEDEFSIMEELTNLREFVDKRLVRQNVVKNNEATNKS